MKRLVVTSLILVLGLSVMAAAATEEALKARAGVYFPFYWILGGAQSEKETASVENRLVVVYTADAAGNVATLYGYGYISGGNFTINTFKNNIVGVGSTYKVAIPRGSDGYGADPLDITISGTGYDVLSGMLKLAYGAGPEFAIGIGEEKAPLIKLWFGNRLYQKALVEKGQTFVISSTPDLKVELAIDSPYTLARNIESHSIVVDEGTTAARTLTLSAANVASTIYAAGTVADEGKISSMTIKYAFEEPLSEGAHSFKVSAASSGALGAATVATETASVEVMGGPVRLIGTPICFPSPFSISKQKKVYIQYTLSTDANIEIYLVGVGGMRIKHWNFMAGAEGGSAGVNKVEWDGRTDQGFLAGNAIYVGTIISKDDNRLLGKVKMTLVD